MLLIITTAFLIANNDNKTDRRGFFQKIRNAYIEGRLENASREEKRILKRKTKEKLRRRKWFEKNVNKLATGMSKRLKHRRSTIMTVVVGGIVIVIWLCHKGSIGCERDQKKSLSSE